MCEAHPTLTPYTLHPQPACVKHTTHPIPWTLHPTPFTLHPSSYTPHPTPCTLNPTPYTRRLCMHRQGVCARAPSLSPSRPPSLALAPTLPAHETACCLAAGDLTPPPTLADCTPPPLSQQLSALHVRARNLCCLLSGLVTCRVVSNLIC